MNEHLRVQKLQPHLCYWFYDIHKIKLRPIADLRHIYGSKFYFAEIWASDRSLFIITLGTVNIFLFRKSLISLGFLKIDVTGIKGRCKVIFESDTGWIFLATSGNGGLWLASTILNIQWEARTGVSVTLKKDFTTALFWVIIQTCLRHI